MSSQAKTDWGPNHLTWRILIKRENWFHINSWEAHVKRRGLTDSSSAFRWALLFLRGLFFENSASLPSQHAEGAARAPMLPTAKAQLLWTRSMLFHSHWSRISPYLPHSASSVFLPNPPFPEVCRIDLLPTFLPNAAPHVWRRCFSSPLLSVPSQAYRGLSAPKRWSLQLATFRLIFL